MKKILSLFLMTLLVMTLVTGCTKKEETIKVGISWAMDYEDAMEDEDINAYIEAVKATGGEPVYLEQATDLESAKENLKKVDCIIMAGGEDVNPTMYGEEMSENCEEPYDERDSSDYYYISAAIEEDMPLLGTCRGMQMLNVVLGGTLYQDLLTEYGNEISHRDPELIDFTYHNIEIEKDSLLYEAMKAENLEVNSWHHQGIKDLGKGLKIVALADDGMIEAIEYTAASYIYGVQFHPEWHIVEGTLDCAPMFEALYNACR